MHTNGGNRWILLAEDDAGVRSMLMIVLEMWGYHVISAGDGIAALDAYNPGQFCLVVTDLSMPKMCGDELARRIKRISPVQPILMLTAYAKEARGGLNPVDQILTKPPTLPELQEAVERLSKSPGVVGT